MVKFNSMRARQKVYRRRTSLRSTNGIWVNEDLVPNQAKLHFQARLLCRAGKLSKSWTLLGQVYVKNEADDSVLKIIDEKDLRAAAALPENYQFEKRKPLIKAFNDGKSTTTIADVHREQAKWILCSWCRRHCRKARVGRKVL